MNAFEKLTEEDFNIVYSWYTKFNAGERALTIDGTKKWLEEKWATPKNKLLFKAMGEELILEKPISFDATEDSLIPKVRAAVRTSGLWTGFDEVFREIKDIKGLGHGDFGILNVIQNGFSHLFFSDSTLIHNSLKEENLKMVFRDIERYRKFREGDDIGETVGEYLDKLFPKTLCAGSKAIKAVSRIAKSFNIPVDSFQKQISEALNQKTCTGILCLSIHPMDYLTMSDNGYGWGSCMSWSKECGTGEERAGTLSMLHSSTAVIAYLKSDKNPNFLIEGINEDFKWNSKKWRQIVYLDENLLIGNNHYPYTSHELTTEVISWLRELSNANIPRCDFSEVEKDFSTDELRGLEFFAGNSEINVIISGAMYSDFHSGGLHLGYYNKVFDSMVGDKLVLNYGGKAICPICLESELYDNLTSCLSCKSGLKECECCYNHVSHLYDGMCSACKSREKHFTHRCDSKECTHNDETIRNILFPDIKDISGNSIFESHPSISICDECLAKYGIDFDALISSGEFQFVGGLRAYRTFSTETIMSFMDIIEESNPGAKDVLLSGDFMLVMDF